MSICPICNEHKSSMTPAGDKLICTDCASQIRKNDLREKASQADDATFFKTWDPKDQTTAFFETFGKYVKDPNKKDFMTIYHIWLWAVHGNKPLAETITYTLKWAKMSIHQEYKKWKQMSN